ncbi:T3JAM protein, partial [Zapornia atra]|nr:T3JAM protein [Zapornia atra]
MISQPQKARPQHRQAESYEEKCERRHETRENRRQRHNATTCRLPGRRAEQPAQSPRQREFLRRRNLDTDAGSPKERKARTPLGPSSWLEPRSLVLLQSLTRPTAPSPPLPTAHLGEMLTRATLSFQHPWSCPTLSLAQPPLRISAAAVPRQGAPVNTQGTQTLTHPHAGVKHSSQQTDSGIAVLNKEMVQLSNYLKEALHRELLLKQKMVILQELFSTLLQASERSWQGQLNEDKLKCKLRVLENQLQTCTQSYSKECVKKILVEMEDQKQTYEQKAKEALQKMLEDKLQTEQQLQNSQRSLAATREDLDFWKEHYATLKAELTRMSAEHAELESHSQGLQSKLQVHTQNEQLQQALGSLQNEHAALRRQASALREDNDLKAERISAMEDKLQKEQTQKVTLEAQISHLHNLIQNQTNTQKTQDVTVQRKDQVFTTQTPPPLTPAKEKQNTLLEHPEEEEEGEESLKDEIQKRTSQLTAKEKECLELRSELEALSEEYRSCLTRLRQCRDELNHFQGKQAKRQRSHWIPLLVALVAVATAAFLTTYRP